MAEGDPKAAPEDRSYAVVPVAVAAYFTRRNPTNPSGVAVCTRACGRVHALQVLPGPEGPEQVLEHGLVGRDEIGVHAVEHLAQGYRLVVLQAVDRVQIGELPGGGCRGGGHGVLQSVGISN